MYNAFLTSISYLLKFLVLIGGEETKYVFVLKGKNFAEIDRKAPGLNILDQEGDSLVEGDPAAILGPLDWKVRCEDHGLGLKLLEESQVDLCFFGSLHLQENDSSSPYVNVDHFI